MLDGAPSISRGQACAADPEMLNMALVFNNRAAGTAFAWNLTLIYRV
jgi:hypothetical protein